MTYPKPWIDYKAISRPWEPGEFEAHLAEVREQRKLREAFPPTQKQLDIRKQHMLDYLEERDEELGYGG